MGIKVPEVIDGQSSNLKSSAFLIQLTLISSRNRGSEKLVRSPESSGIKYRKRIIAATATEHSTTRS